MPSSTSASDKAPVRAGSKPRIVVYGNAGAGKTTMARALARELAIDRLCLDHIAWTEAAVRKPLAESLAELEAFLAGHRDGWVIEGCYGDLVEVAVAHHCTELRFLNPGIEACTHNCEARPWDAEYCESPQEQQRMLAPLLEFVRDYETRTDECSLTRHRAILDAFDGRKTEFTSLASYNLDGRGSAGKASTPGED